MVPTCVQNERVTRSESPYDAATSVTEHMNAKPFGPTRFHHQLLNINQLIETVYTSYVIHPFTDTDHVTISQF